MNQTNDPRLASSSPETRVLQLLNMLTAEQLVDEYEYQDIYEDIQQECERFGKIYSITIPRPRIVDGKLDPTIPVHGVGRVRVLSYSFLRSLANIFLLTPVRFLWSILVRRKLSRGSKCSVAGSSTTGLS